MCAAYEDEDELLWSPGSLPESKVRGFLSDVSSRTADDKTGCDKPGIHVRDNERVSNVHTDDSDFVAQGRLELQNALWSWKCHNLLLLSTITFRL